MTCPDHAQLLAFLRGERTADLNSHVESCPHCQTALANLGTLDDAAVRRAAQLPAVPPTTAEPPRMLGSYRLLRRLGAPSGQGEVWLAEHGIIGFLSAIKILRPDRSGREAMEQLPPRDATLRQARPPQHRRHPPRRGDRRPAHPVHALHRRPVAARTGPAGGPLAVADACELIRQAAAGLQYAHSKGVVHRDVKPGNLMVDRTLTVKVLDFGLARDGTAEAAGVPLTLDTAILGTPEYMAPEQASGASKVDIRPDLYALGCTLYFLLTGEPPFTAESEGNRLNVLHAHCNKPVPSLRQRRPDVPPSLATLLETRLLAKKPEDRLDTPAKLGIALQPYTRGYNLAQLVGVTAPAVLPAPLSSGVAAPLDAALSLVFWDAGQKQRLTLDEPGVLPVKEGDEFRVEVR